MLILTIHGLFDLASHYFCKEDESIGLFIDTLRISALLDNSILLIHGDYNSLNRDELAKEFNKNFSQDYLYQSYQKVPLIVRLPKGQDSGIYHKSVGQNDISPTLLGLLNTKNFTSLGNEYYNNVKNSTYDLTTGKQLQSNNSFILKAKNDLLPSDKIFLYIYLFF